MKGKIGVKRVGGEVKRARKGRGANLFFFMFSVEKVKNLVSCEMSFASGCRLAAEVGTLEYGDEGMRCGMVKGYVLTAM